MLEGCAWICYGSGEDGSGDMQMGRVRENFQQYTFTRYVFSLLSWKYTEEQGPRDRCSDP